MTALLVLACALLPACGGGADEAAPGAASPAAPPGAAAPSTPPPTEAAQLGPASPPAGPPPPAAPPPPPEAPAPAATVMLQGRSYEPLSVEVPAGSSVAFTDALPTRHTVTAGTRDAPEPARFDEMVAGEGTTVTIGFPEPGTYPFFCRIHFGMRGQVVVR